ncbi:hypothetical protein VKT23_020147 [Stygiomarasmius scandens]|uniref:Uncharacterized protein n=1 Tax=Marasmiellus scandens TaxID=2682957 RepID=A0ABR1INT2_9AGAR
MLRVQAIGWALQLVCLAMMATNVQSLQFNSDPPIGNITIIPRTKDWPRPVTLPHDKHPSPTKNIFAFHGTDNLEVARTILRTNLIISDIAGDFNPGRANVISGAGGAAYLADSLMASAQFVCYSKNSPTKITHAHIVRFELEGAGAKVYRFQEKDETWQFFVYCNLEPGCLSHYKNSQNADDKRWYAWVEETFKNHIIEGFMDGADDEKLTPNFWQYAIIKPDFLKDKLKPVAVYESIPCNKVPQTTSLKDTDYLAGQYTNPEAFDALLMVLGVKQSQTSLSQSPSSRGNSQ